MTDITQTNQHVPAPERDRRNHVPAVGDIYLRGNGYDRAVRITAIKTDGKYTHFEMEDFSFLEMKWKPSSWSVSPEDLSSYYILFLGDFNEYSRTAMEAIAGNTSAIEKMLSDSAPAPESEAVMLSKPAEQVLSITETAERLEDKLETIRSLMDIAIEQKKREMESKVDALNEHLKKITKQVKNLHRVITVMNLYTGKGVSLEVVCDGEPASGNEPIHVRQRILFMDEEYLADAENGGIDFQKIDEFNRWLAKPVNRDIVLPEPKCIVAMKPKRYNAHYSSNWYVNEEMNQWNHHTLVYFRDGERILMLESEDLELFGTAIPYSDQMERFEKKYQKIMSDRSFQEHNLELLQKESERLGYMYTKYISFLQGVVDSNEVFLRSDNRPNFATETGVRFIRDDEMAIGTGETWSAFQKRINGSIRRGTRVVFFPYGHDERGCEVSCGKPNRYYYYDSNAPAAPKKGIYNVDYPTKTDHVKNPETGRYEKVTGKTDQLAIFYAPERWGSDNPRMEAWIYNEWCVLNYDLLTVEDIDRFMADRTQRESFRAWMPILQEARRKLVEEKDLENTFKKSLEYRILNENPSFPSESIGEALDEAIRWWKNKVIFSRPLSSDDAKAWRMIKKHCVNIINETHPGGHRPGPGER